MVLRPQRESIYCATKAAVSHLARALAVEWAEYNIQVNAVSPGYIDTEMNDVMIEKYPDQVGNWLKDCPAGRFCKVWELKGVYVFLASQASSYVTGADYVVDGASPPQRGVARADGRGHRRAHVPLARPRAQCKPSSLTRLRSA